MRLGQLVEFDGLQVRWDKSATKRIENNPIVDRFGMAKKYSTIQHRHFVTVGWLKGEICLSESKYLRIQFNRFQSRGRERFFEELIKTAASQANHKHIFGIGMKSCARRDKLGVRHYQARPIVQVHRRLAIKFAAPETAHLHDRSNPLDRDVIIRRFDRDGRYLSKTIAGKAGCD
jgi:hypothetical protein